MYRLVNLSKYYNSDNKVSKALDNINLEIKENEFVMISGPSGSGKSTLLNVLSGIDTYQDGEMYFDNQETSYYDNKDYEKFRYENISFVFQEYNLIESFSCYENLEVALISKNIDFTHDDIIKLLSKVHLEDKEKVKAAKLSGGQKARLAIARALASNARILVMDEPTGALDSKSSEDVLEILKELKGKKTIIVVTHNEELFSEVANHHIKILDGKIKEDKVLEDVPHTSFITNAKTKKYNKALKLSLLNIKNQPKKSILSFALSLVLTIFTVFSISGLAFMSKENNTIYNLSNTPERIIINNKDGFSEEEYSSFSKDSNLLIKESYLLDVDISSNIRMHDNYIFKGLSSEHLKEDSLAAGRLPSAPNEIVLPYDKYVVRDKERYLDKNINISVSADNYRFYGEGLNFDLNAKIVGIANTSYYYFNDASNINTIIYYLKEGKLPNFTNFVFDYNASLDGVILNSNETPFIVDGNNLNIVVEPSIEDYVCIINPLYLKDYLDNKNHSISLFFKDPSNYGHKLDSKYSYYIPTIINENIDINRIFVTMFSLIFGGLLCLLIYLTNIITRQIYKYKNKDNAILSSLGYDNKELKKSLVLELLLNYAISIVLCFIVVSLDYAFNICKGALCAHSIWSVLIIISIVLVAIYFGVKNVFKIIENNSLFKNLRGGDLDA